VCFAEHSASDIPQITCIRNSTLCVPQNTPSPSVQHSSATRILCHNIIIHEYQETGLKASISDQHIYCRHELHVIEAPSVNAFKNRLDKHRSDMGI